MQNKTRLTSSLFTSKSSSLRYITIKQTSVRSFIKQSSSVADLAVCHVHSHNHQLKGGRICQLILVRAAKNVNNGIREGPCRNGSWGQRCDAAFMGFWWVALAREVVLFSVFVGALSTTGYWIKVSWFAQQIKNTSYFVIRPLFFLLLKFGRVFINRSYNW